MRLQILAAVATRGMILKFVDPLFSCMGVNALSARLCGTLFIYIALLHLSRIHAYTGAVYRYIFFNTIRIAVRQNRYRHVQ